MKTETITLVGVIVLVLMIASAIIIPTLTPEPKRMDMQLDYVGEDHAIYTITEYDNIQGPIQWNQDVSLLNTLGYGEGSSMVVMAPECDTTYILTASQNGTILWGGSFHTQGCSQTGPAIEEVLP